ncbi:hypothetical protein L7F22_065747 [Adiantum nelumboides]|nr:hypothetical protein [Adiantum nelumboides]
MRGSPSIICRLLIVLLSIDAVGQWINKGFAAEAARTVEMELVYRYANEFKQAKGGNWRAGSLEQHERLMRRDKLRHAARGRGLLAVSLLPSNETANLDVLGGLHYSLINIGTPSKTFLVALDTGSDLLWVPCNCQQCSTTNWAAYGLQTQDFDFAVYNQSGSSTSKSLPCTSSLCSNTLTSTTSCTSGAQTCNYVITYMSSGTSTSGHIVQDLLYLNYEASTGGNTSTPIYFGCGEVQTGDLVKGVAPNGLFGLGPEAISVPSTLARNGIISSNSFSMCFSDSDSSGRLVFGVEALEGIPITPLVPINPSVYYVVATTKIALGADSIDASDNLIFDTGTSYTTLPLSTYQKVGEMMNKQINLPQFQLNGTFDYCWNTSDNNVLNSLPTLTLTFVGGRTWDISDAYVTFVDSRANVVFFCLGVTAISSSTGMGIIGHNFMGGYEFFFNQQAMTFGWAPSTCYNLNASTVAIGSPEEGPSIVNRAGTPSSSAVPKAPLMHATLLFIISLFATTLLL